MSFLAGAFLGSFTRFNSGSTERKPDGGASTSTSLSKAVQDSSGYGSGSQQPSGVVARDETIDLTESNSTQREPSPSPSSSPPNHSSTGAVDSHASRKRKTDYEGQLVVKSRLVELHPGCSRKSSIEASRTPSHALSIQNTPKPHTGVFRQQYSDGMAKKPYGGDHRPQDSLNQPRFAQRSPSQMTYGKTSSHYFKHFFEDNGTNKQVDSYEFPDDDHFPKRRRIQKPNPNTSSPGEIIKLDDDEQMSVAVTSFKSHQESLPRRNSQVSSASKRDTDFIGPQTTFRNVESRMKPNPKRAKPGPNSFYTPKTTDNGEVSPYFAQSNGQRLRQTPPSRSFEKQVEPELKYQPNQQGQLHSLIVDDDDIIELPHSDATRKKEYSETGHASKDICESNRYKSPIRERTPPTIANRIGDSNNEDPDTSFDELHGPATMGNISPNGLPSERGKIVGHPTELAEHHEYDVPASSDPLEHKSASDIPITQFSFRDNQESKTIKQPANKKRRGKFPEFVLESLNLSHDRRLCGPKLILMYVEDTKEFIISSNGSQVFTEPRLAANNVNNCLFSHPYVRLRGPKIDDRIICFDLKFTKEENSKEFLRILDKWNVSPHEKTNDDMQKMFSRAEAAERSSTDKREIDLLRKQVELVDHQTTVQEECKPRDRRRMIWELRAPRESPCRQVRSNIPYPSRNDKPVESEVDLIPLEWEEVVRGYNTVRTRSATKRQRLALPDEVVLEEERYSVRHGLGEVWDQPIVYPRTGKKRTTVEQSDLIRLDEGEFLNDSIIEFYIRWLNDKFKVPEHQVYFFSTHFYTALTRTNKGQRGINYAAVERWTAKDDIFIHDFVIVPVNEATHWYLAIICNLPNIKRKLDLENKVDNANDRLVSSAPQVGDDEPDLMEIDPTEPPMSPTHNLSIQYSNLEVGKQSHAKTLLKEPPSSSEPIYVLDEEEESSRMGKLKQIPITPQIKPASDILPNSQTSDIGVFADATSSPSSARKAKKKSGPPPRKYDPTQPAVVILDSLNSAHGKTISNLKDYLIAEASSKRGLELSRDDFRGINAKEGIPLQDNSCDCGLYLLGYIHKFMEDPKLFGHKLLLQEFDLHNDWPNMVPSVMRNGIRKELMRIHAEQKAEREANRKAKKVAKKMGKTMTAAQAKASSSLEKEVKGSTTHQDGILQPPSHQVVINQPVTSAGSHNSPSQQQIEDAKSYPDEVDANNVDYALLFDEHSLGTPIS